MYLVSFLERRGVLNTGKKRKKGNKSFLGQKQLID